MEEKQPQALEDQQPEQTLEESMEVRPVLPGQEGPPHYELPVWRSMPERQVGRHRGFRSRWLKRGGEPEGEGVARRGTPVLQLV